MPTSAPDRTEFVKLLTLHGFLLIVWWAIDDADTALRAGRWLIAPAEINSAQNMLSLARIVLIGQQVGRGGQHCR
jgi:hypothetical protein